MLNLLCDLIFKDKGKLNSTKEHFLTVDMDEESVGYSSSLSKKKRESDLVFSCEEVKNLIKI